MTRFAKAALFAASAGALAASATLPAHAAGFYVQEQSASALGGAYSGAASDTGAASLWWNPAAIGGVEGTDTYAGFHIVSVNATVTDQGSTIQRPFQPVTGVGGQAQVSDPVETGYIPNLALARKLTDRWSIGLAVTAPFDFTTKYESTSWSRYEALTSRLLDLDLQPTVAFRAASWLDLGVGFDAEYADARLTSALPNLSPALPDGDSELKGHGWNYGWVAGAQGRAGDRLSIGASYRSSIDHELDGSVTVSGLLGPLSAANVAAPGQARFSTPWIATLGARFRADARWTLTAQVQRFGWSEFKAIDVTFAGTEMSTPENYHDTTSEAVGAEYALSPKVALRAGVQHDPTPTPDVGRTAQVPDGDRWLFGVGTTWSPRPRTSIDAGFAYVHFDPSHIASNATAYAGTPLVTPITLMGLVQGDALVFSAGLRQRF